MDELTIEERKDESTVFYFSITQKRKEVGRARLIIAKNSLHEKPFGLLEDVFVYESHRGKGIGSTLIKSVISKAQKIGCYKLIATSRYQRKSVHKLYGKLGFCDTSKGFRINF